MIYPFIQTISVFLTNSARSLLDCSPFALVTLVVAKKRLMDLMAEESGVS